MSDNSDELDALMNLPPVLSAMSFIYSSSASPNATVYTAIPSSTAFCIASGMAAVFPS